MIFHILIVLFVVVFWNYPVSVSLFDKSLALPFSFVVLFYIASVYLSMKAIVLFNKLFDKNFSQSKIEAAKHNIVEAFVAYSGANIEHGNRLWEENKKYLKNDKLFKLLALMNYKFLPQESKQAQLDLGVASSLIKNLFDKNEFVESYAKLDLEQLFKHYKAPWIYKALISHYLKHNQINKAELLLKEFWKSGSLKFDEWSKLKANILFKQGILAENEKLRINFFRKANRLDKTQAVLGLVHYYQKSKDITQISLCIQNAWKEKPCLKLGKIYVELDEEALPIHRFQYAKELRKFNENHPVSHLLIATYAMDCELWAIAHEALLKFSTRYAILGDILLARLEAKKNGNTEKIWEHIEKAFVLIAKQENFDDVEDII